MSDIQSPERTEACILEKQHRLQAEVKNYRHLRSLQGHQIRVCFGVFQPRVAYWYHGELMAQMMILSWSGTRLQYVNDENSSFFHQERDKALAVLRSHGVVHSDGEWRNMLWDGLGGRLVVIDLEDAKPSVQTDCCVHIDFVKVFDIIGRHDEHLTFLGRHQRYVSVWQYRANSGCRLEAS
ncbi:hypothetical protein PENARI_c069G02882 [Penicillium arizonense]|uniref:Aminoglycoside phosphotransferase domain-containing protein n=1 Tax=Penicillium arizonense TaxID=1835702 RepID=A0A1F5L1D6_PENAI|nr:hypothetical protein PENARI_c069G02882 [Penicillium arizonense]OGE47058.1 hypothetical protein PENARI_c069G02882 [Penicillium arizonense]